MNKIIFKKLIFFSVVISITIAVIFLLRLQKSSSLFTVNKKPQIDHQPDCIIKPEEKIVRGHSLSGLIEPGQTVKILFGFYNCNKIKREDIVAYNYAGNSEPIIKIVKGVPGDKFHLEPSGSGWHLLINGAVAKNSEETPYLFNKQSYKMLSLYEKDYKGVIPKNAYLILGNLASGSLDSTRFGLIDKSGILGKVESIKTITIDNYRRFS